MEKLILLANPQIKLTTFNSSHGKGCYTLRISTFDELITESTLSDYFFGDLNPLPY